MQILGGGEIFEKKLKKSRGVNLAIFAKIVESSNWLGDTSNLCFFFPVSIIILVVRDWISVKCWHIKNAT